ncbi:hypothetical protein OS493_037553 [Desmophyllum pertusum]|uniref:Nephrocystin 3-like N-terminal domain-containing protein n=1 Tax=Desmophyllum pertusum TaxID=174260 RepID=A0A9X0CUG3_9CNID|nr:hypothetical protein OS493_037553 [Desmophyllum pertusum]
MNSTAGEFLIHSELRRILSSSVMRRLPVLKLTSHFFPQRHDPDTRQWLFDDFGAWFRDPGDSRAYVLLGDPGVGKSVFVAVLAQRTRGAGHLGAAYFCRHNDGTRNDPRYLLGTIASQLCDCNTQYKAIVGGEGGVKMLLSNSKLRVGETLYQIITRAIKQVSAFSAEKVSHN